MRNDCSNPTEWNAMSTSGGSKPKDQIPDQSTAYSDFWDGPGKGASQRPGRHSRARQIFLLQQYQDGDEV